MKERTHVLSELLRDFVHRRDYSCLKEGLPQLYDFVVFVNLSPKQKLLYKTYLVDFFSLLFLKSNCSYLFFKKKLTGESKGRQFKI